MRMRPRRSRRSIGLAGRVFFPADSPSASQREDCAHLTQVVLQSRLRVGTRTDSSGSVGELGSDPSNHAISGGLTLRWWRLVGPFARETARPSQRVAKQELDLGVQAAQVVVGPALNALENTGVDSQEKGFSLRHDG